MKTMEELDKRLRRIYSSIDVTVNYDPAIFAPKKIFTEKMKGILQDFSGNQTQEEIENLALSMVHNIANLRDHLRGWAKNNGQDKERVEEAFSACEALKLIQDLSNAEKHGGRPRDGGHSKKMPKLSNISRVLSVATGTEKGSSVEVRLSVRGDLEIKKKASGSAIAIITGDITDENGNRVGFLHDIASEAMESWENLLEEFGIKF